jgi:putative solute:sodium symporter small subunit
VRQRVGDRQQQAVGGGQGRGQAASRHEARYDVGQARDLDFAFFGWPFSFWVAAQGGVIVFVVLLAVYARRMARNDRRLAREGGVDDGGAAGAPHR